MKMQILCAAETPPVFLKTGGVISLGTGDGGMLDAMQKHAF